MDGISQGGRFDQKHSKMMFSEPSPVIDNNPASGSQPNFSSRIPAVLQPQNHDKRLGQTSKLRLNLKTLASGISGLCYQY